MSFEKIKTERGKGHNKTLNPWLSNQEAKEISRRLRREQDKKEINEHN